MTFFLKRLWEVILKLEQWKWQKWEVFDCFVAFGLYYRLPITESQYLMFVELENISQKYFFWPILYKSIKRNSKFDGSQFCQESSVLFQIPVPEKSFPIFLTNKKHSAVPFRYFEKNMGKTRTFLKFSILR